MLHWISFFTFFYINKQKKVLVLWTFLTFGFWWFMHFGISWSRFDCFWKMSVCVWQKFCGNCSSRTNWQIFILSKHKLISINFWCKLLKRRCCSYSFSEISGICWSWFLVDEIAQKFLWKICIIGYNHDPVWIHAAQ